MQTDAHNLLAEELSNRFRGLKNSVWFEWVRACLRSSGSVAFDVIASGTIFLDCIPYALRILVIWESARE